MKQEKEEMEARSFSMQENFNKPALGGENPRVLHLQRSLTIRTDANHFLQRS